MKCSFVFVFCSFLLFQIPSFAQTTYFIKYKSSVSADVVESNIAQKKLSNSIGDRALTMPQFKMDYLAKGLGRGDEVLGRIVKVQFAQDISESSLNSILANDPNIEYIQKSNTYKLDFVPNDSLFGSQWALEKIKAFDAWDITTGADTVLVAVIDMGMDYDHIDLINNLYENSGEIGIDDLGADKRFNGIDDDSNGFVDDFKGWDFTDRVGFPFDSSGGDYLDWDNDPRDDSGFSLASGHGTQVAGVIAAESNNLFGIAGAAPNISILNLRSFDPTGNGEEDDAAAAILYAVKMGAKIINMSWGDYKFSYILRDVIKYAHSQNCVLIASAGNDNLSTPHYPSGYSEVISVSGSNENDYTVGFNWGSTIDLIAPGISILTTDLLSKYTTKNGTSFSAPFVSAAAALILSLQNFANEEIKQILKSTADDVGEFGWDEKSGAGRLNMERALRVLAPSNIKINFPSMDYGTFADSLTINANVLSSYFLSYNLEIGSGYIPEDWTPLMENGLNQFADNNIYTLNLSNYDDGSYTLRLVVNTNNGRPTEERVTFHIMRTAPQVYEVGLGAIYYGSQSTIAGEFETNQPSIMKLFYRKVGESNFNFISLDGFATNNQFVKQYHYGFIPKDLISPSTNYEVYFEAENLAGLKTIVMDSTNGINYFNIKTEDFPNLTSYQEMPFELPNGVLYPPHPVSFLSNNSNEVLFQTLYESKNAIFSNYILENNNFVRNTNDSLVNRYPRFYGDFNNNGLKDLLVANVSAISSLEQINPNLFTFSRKDSTDKLALSLLVDELLNDGTNYLISENFDKSPSRYMLWKIKSDLTTSIVDTFYIPKYDSLRKENNSTTETIIVDDIDSDGLKEIWFMDSDADLRSFIVNNDLSFTKSDSLFVSGLYPSIYNDNLSIGNYDGVGNKDIAVLTMRNSIAPTYFLRILTFQNHQPQIISEKVFLDLSAEYRGGLSSNDFFASLKFVDVDNDEVDELVLNMFPYTYILKHSNGIDNIIFYKEGSNTEHVFVGDLNQNGVPEIALNLNKRFKFFEFSISNRTSIPSLVKGFSISPSTVQLSWISNSPKFYIYKGANKNNLELVDSTSVPTYYDTDIILDSTYYYAIRAFDSSKPEPLSGMSNNVEVFAHTPAKLTNAKSNSNRSVIVTFSEKMKNTIENLQAFNVAGVGYPNSVTANDQYSYLLSFDENLIAGEHKIIIQSLKDFYNSPIETDSLIFTATPIIEAETFFVSNFEIVNPYKIKLTFNYPVEENLANNIGNYNFEPDNKVSSVNVDLNDAKTIYLDLTGNKPVGSIGKEYVLRISNLSSSSTTGSLPINTGAGSYIVLSTYAKDLSDVYVYPNPTKTGIDKITFANLPQRAKITIWSVDGKLVNEIEETDGNGGVDFNLSDQNGNSISSGIYIYRIVQLDDQLNEGEEKLGKFAVVR